MITVLRKQPAKFISAVLLGSGVFILMQIILPITSFQIWAFAQNISNQKLISPQDPNSILGISVEDRDNFPAFISYITRETLPSYNVFTLSVPRLALEKENVFVDSNDLAKGMAHLPGSALPGEKGNVFISGHSALSKFLAGQSAPFAKLLELKKGDEIIALSAGSKFVYKVMEIKIVDPNDLSVIPAPEGQGRYISLMTCVPPGLNLKRLVVLGKMI